MLELQVADNGAGLENVNEALVLFSSTKSGYGLQQGRVQNKSCDKIPLYVALNSAEHVDPWIEVGMAWFGVSGSHGGHELRSLLHIQ